MVKSSKCCYKKLASVEYSPFSVDGRHFCDKFKVPVFGGCLEIASVGRLPKNVCVCVCVCVCVWLTDSFVVTQAILLPKVM